jgi:hypothetical protein
MGTPTEEFEVSGDNLVQRVKELIHQGNIRRITIKNKEGTTLVEIPLTAGVVGSVLLPVWVAIGAIAALAASFTIAVEVIDGSDQKPVEGTTPDGTASGGD